MASGVQRGAYQMENKEARTFKTCREVTIFLMVESRGRYITDEEASALQQHFLSCSDCDEIQNFKQYISNLISRRGLE